MHPRAKKIAAGSALAILIVAGLFASVRALAQQGYINYNFGANQVFSSMRVNGGLWLRARSAVTNALPGFGDAVVEGKVIGQEDQSVRFCSDAAQGCAAVSGSLGFAGELALDRQDAAAQTIDAADITADTVQARGTSVEFGGTGTQVNTCIDATTGAAQSCAQGQLLANIVTAPRIESANGIGVTASSQINFAQGLSVPADTICKVVSAEQACPTGFDLDASTSAKRGMQSDLSAWQKKNKSVVNELGNTGSARLCCNAEIKSWPAKPKVPATCQDICKDVVMTVNFGGGTGGSNPAGGCTGNASEAVSNIRVKVGAPSNGYIFRNARGSGQDPCPNADDGYVWVFRSSNPAICELNVIHWTGNLDGGESSTVKITTSYNGYSFGQIFSSGLSADGVSYSATKSAFNSQVTSCQ